MNFFLITVYLFVIINERYGFLLNQCKVTDLNLRCVYKGNDIYESTKGLEGIETIQFDKFGSGSMTLAGIHFPVLKYVNINISLINESELCRHISTGDEVIIYVVASNITCTSEKQLKLDFMELLKETPSIHHASRWKQVKDVIEMDPRYKDVKIHNPLKKWFKEYLQKLGTSTTTTPKLHVTSMPTDPSSSITMGTSTTTTTVTHDNNMTTYQPFVPNVADSSEPEHIDSDTDVQIIIGSVVGGVVITLVICVASYFAYRKWRQGSSSRNQDIEERSPEEDEAIPPFLDDTASVTNEHNDTESADSRNENEQLLTASSEAETTSLCEHFPEASNSIIASAASNVDEADAILGENFPEASTSDNANAASTVDGTVGADAVSRPHRIKTTQQTKNVREYRADILGTRTSLGNPSQKGKRPLSTQRSQSFQISTRKNQPNSGHYGKEHFNPADSLSMDNLPQHVQLPERKYCQLDYIPRETLPPSRHAKYGQEKHSRSSKFLHSFLRGNKQGSEAIGSRIANPCNQQRDENNKRKPNVNIDKDDDCGTFQSRSLSNEMKPTLSQKEISDIDKLVIKKGLVKKNIKKFQREK